MYRRAIDRQIYGRVPAPAPQITHPPSPRFLLLISPAREIRSDLPRKGNSWPVPRGQFFTRNKGPRGDIILGQRDPGRSASTRRRSLSICESEPRSCPARVIGRENASAALFLSPIGGPSAGKMKIAARVIARTPAELFEGVNALMALAPNATARERRLKIAILFNKTVRLALSVFTCLPW